MSPQTDFIRLFNAQLRYYFHYKNAEIQAMSDQEWAENIADLQWIETQKGKKENP